MQIKDVIGECLVKMGEVNFVNKQNPTDEETALMNKLLGALNIAYREIVADYLPKVYTQKISAVDGKIDVEKLDKNILYPISVKIGGERVTYYTDATSIYLSGAGEAEIKYAYMPDGVLALNSELVDMRLTMSALSDATLAEYYFQEKVFELAKSFDTDFRAQIGLLRYKGKGVCIKRRRWQV